MLSNFTSTCKHNSTLHDLVMQGFIVSIDQKEVVMNIFILDLDPTKCAQMHVDKHVVKMITEYTQLLCTTANLHGFNAPMKSTHVNHPCRLWLEESFNNIMWLERLLYHLHEEWKHRYNHADNKCHLSYYKYKEFDKDTAWSVFTDDIPDIPMTPYPLCMPDDCKVGNDPVLSYRNYYNMHKRDLFAWKNRETPNWIIKEE